MTEMCLGKYRRTLFTPTYSPITARPLLCVLTTIPTCFTGLDEVSVGRCVGDDLFLCRKTALRIPHLRHVRWKARSGKIVRCLLSTGRNSSGGAILVEPLHLGLRLAWFCYRNGFSPEGSA